MSVLLGCIADDFTGATDLANTLVRHGMRTVQFFGVPGEEHDPGYAEAVVVALKSRTAPAEDAAAWSLAALEWLRARGARQIFFKYCSTFDSTDRGNIGPVADALAGALGGAAPTIVCPAFPTNGRTVYKGHLFVGDVLLSDSGMKDHPLTPMRDANLVRVMQRQSAGRVGLVQHATVAGGAQAIAEALEALRAGGFGHAVVDAVNDADLMAIGEAARDLPLVTGGSGVALGLPENFRRAGLAGAARPPVLPGAGGRGAVLAGSCSEATRRQVAAARERWPVIDLEPGRLSGGEDPVAAILDGARRADPALPLVVASSAPPEAVAEVQASLGRDVAGALVESAFARIAAGLVAQGFRRLVVAGGETSGAVVGALGVRGIRIGPEIDPGVPWCETLEDPTLALALKSGNFGSRDFFAKALEMLP